MNWQNRIVEYGVKPADQFTAHPDNWRLHPQHQRDIVEASLNELGWIAPVVESLHTGYLIDGHERVMQALKDNRDVPYVVVDLTEAEELLALSIYDPSGALALPDDEKLAKIIAAIDIDSPQLAAFTDTISGDEFKSIMNALSYAASTDIMPANGHEDETYTTKIETPLYEPQGEQPPINELYNDENTMRLYMQIETADIPQDVKDFLRVAAQRHTQFNFSKIADYYAHAPAEVQRLFEDSALVIIDFKRAIELGFVQVTERIAEMVRDEYGE